MIIHRQLRETLQESLSQFPVVAILGARQTGKTTLAKDIASHFILNSVYLDLELPSDLNKLEDAELFLDHLQDKLVILDEIQRKPELFSVLRSLIDKQRRPGRFLVLGSASPHLIRQSSETLAGRIIYHELPPLTIHEIGSDLSNIKKLWVQGGYPSAFLTDSNKANRWLSAYINTFLERDIPQLGFRVSAGHLRKFWLMLSHYHSQLWNASQIASNLDITAQTVRHLLSILEGTYMARVL
ncbi:MAG: ATP-binding protein, partial [Candidatus Margulisiibacteriota bacterium]